MATTVLTPRAVTYPRAAIYEWITTTDHKKIGILYVTAAFIFFLAGGILALLIRSELALPGSQVFDPDSGLYNQVFTMHGTTMIFLFVMPMLAGFANYVVPLQIGAADMAFPRINALSFWMIPLSGILMFSGFFLGGAAASGWTSYAPLSAREAAPGQDLWIVGLILNGTSSILSAINFIATIFKLRAPGMTLLRMPIFVWTQLTTSVLLLFAVPVLTAGVIMLFIDRNYGGSFFNPAAGGDPILWQHVFWFFGHPEVYIMILPAMGVVSEVLPVFSRKPLFGYKAFVLATAQIGLYGWAVWAHHMFTTGAVYIPFFAFFTFLIAVPTGIKMFNWIATMWRGQLRFTSAMLFAIGFLSAFLIGGLDGAFVASAPFDFHVQDTYWVVSHLHYVLLGGSAFGIFAAFYYWFPKMFGRRLDEGLGKVHWLLFFVGQNIAFFPQHLLGLDGMPRRIQDYSPTAGWTELNMLSTVGAFLIAISILPFIWNLFVTFRGPKDAEDDPWDANTLEWATTSPPPPYNFERLPPITSERPLFDLKYGHVAGVETEAEHHRRAIAQYEPPPEVSRAASTGETEVAHRAPEAEETAESARVVGAEPPPAADAGTAERGTDRDA
ncbi:MAG: cytochrome c oxidase subunit I, partial [Chloroflexota bacterium]|nr:cytochrome c oxidase subunit I [Chloroflexota bacterium]